MRVTCDRLTVLIVIRGTWSDSEPERLLRAVLKFARQRQNVFTGHILEDGANQMKLLDNLKKEFRLNRIYWRQIFDRWHLGLKRQIKLLSAKQTYRSNVVHQLVSNT